MKKQWTVLTGDVTTRGELCRHRGVHRNHDLIFVSHDCIMLLNLIVDPGLEVLPEDGRADIHYPLLGYYAKVWFVGKVHVLSLIHI